MINLVWENRKKRLEKLLSAVPSSDFYLKPKWEKYAMQRLQWLKKDGSLTDFQEVRDAVGTIYLLNGRFGSEIQKEHDNLMRVTPILGREKMFLDEMAGVLYIAQPSSISRGNRFEDMIYTGAELSQPDWKLNFQSHLFIDKQNTQRTYEKNAYDFVKSISIDNDKLRDIDYVTIGPLNWFKKHASDAISQIISHSADSEYLDYMVSEIDGKKVLSIDYTYSDQMDTIVNELLKTFSGETYDGGRDVHILMYGKVGGIRPPQKVNNLILPNGIIDINEFERTPSYSGFTQLKNAFGGNGKNQNYIFNASSVPFQRRSALIKGQGLGCSLAEMEAVFATGAINVARARYKDELNIHQGYAGFFSDTPLDPNSSTLADYHIDQSPGRRKVVHKVVDYIVKH